MSEETVYTVERDLPRPAVQRELAQADVVIGHDRSQKGHETCFGGRSALERVAKLDRPEPLSIARFSYDSKTSSLERLVAACMVLRGSCDYRSDDDGRDFVASMRQAWGGA